MTTAHAQRVPWEDKFDQPDDTAILAHYDETQRGYFQTLKAGLAAHEGPEQSVLWQGVSWKWTYTYALPKDQDNGPPNTPWAYLTPTHERPSVIAPVTDAIVDAMPTSRLKRFIRDGLKAKKPVGNVRWAAWRCNAKHEVEETLDVTKRILALRRA